MLKRNLKRFRFIGIMMALCLVLVACNDSQSVSGDNGNEADTKKNKETQTLSYLGKEYTVPAKAENIATASLESMEDAAVLGIKPVATITVGGKIPDYVADKLQGAKSIGEKKQPDHETLLSLKPDVIFGSSKFQPEVVKNLNKIAPMLPVSHIATDWEENLKLMGKVTDTEDKATEIITQYKEDATALKDSLSTSLQGKSVVMARIRGGNIFLYQKDIYFNPVLYQDLGLEAPKAMDAVKAQEMISLEKFAEMNPDYLFVQFAEGENAKQPQALKDLQKNPIWKSMNAVKNDHVFVNTVDPMFQGGTAWSKSTFIKAAKDALTSK